MSNRLDKFLYTHADAIEFVVFFSPFVLVAMLATAGWTVVEMTKVIHGPQQGTPRACGCSQAYNPDQVKQEAEPQEKEGNSN